MFVNYYYSDELTNDDEGNLVQLCHNCATGHETGVEWAQRGDTESECELCPATNDQYRTDYLDNSPYA